MLTIVLFLLGKSLIGINILFSNSFSLIPFTMQFALLNTLIACKITNQKMDKTKLQAALN